MSWLDGLLDSFRSSQLLYKRKIQPFFLLQILELSLPLVEMQMSAVDNVLVDCWCLLDTDFLLLILQKYFNSLLFFL